MLDVLTHDPPRGKIHSITLRGHFEEVIVVVNKIKDHSKLFVNGEDWPKNNDEEESDDVVEVTLRLAKGHNLTPIAVENILEDAQIQQKLEVTYNRGKS